MSVHFSTSHIFKKFRQLIFIFTFGAISTVQAAGIVLNTASAPASTSLAAKPLWVTLAPQQKLALAPLAPEWDKMDEIRKKKWLEIANKYASMNPDEQARVQERMQAWMKLTPEQRMQARENFARTTQIKPELKSAQWQQYQQLSEDQKKQLANEANRRKSVTNLPPESQRNIKPLAPIKTGPKSVSQTPLQQPAQPQINSANTIMSAPASQSSSK